MAAHDGQPALGANWTTMLKAQGTMTCLTHVSQCRVTEFQEEGKGRFSQATMLSHTCPIYASDRKLGKDTRCLAVK